ncbi:MAG: reactive intermediate/imine deaminase [Bacteroidetes bacterium CG18_big_fil_WC_8_21_14_2_50_41_14]|nr:MAG: reactive intermediate/imine deaminase [Bacteroidetes bacterium CG18_big_fil_WC_8_21_14_2_50_41_14]PJB59789.1 MAG: reactive intermediate/imine deaminase [Bacteroidetes bacterium CG_4_9_14_3_um_filter_41_19]
MKRVIFTNNAPAPIGPYSQAVENNGMLFISGQVPIDPVTGKIVEGGVVEQTRQVMENIRAIVKAADFGNDLSKILKCTIYLSDMSLFGAMNEVYGTYFPTQPPARAAFAVKGLPLGALVEIEAVAMR